MKRFDRVLQRWRVRKAARHIPNGAHVLDVGCADGALFDLLKGRVTSGVGIDPGEVPANAAGFRFVRGTVPGAVPSGETFDAITMLAVLEHIPQTEQRELAGQCLNLLKPGGRLIITVPSPRVDHIIEFLQKLRLLDGMAEEEHYGFEPGETVGLFTQPGLALREHRRFQLGLNNLYVFARL